MSDLISRQAAMEIIQSMYPGMPRVPWMRNDWQNRYEPYIRTENAIRALPSAQPEIIRCKECKHYREGEKLSPQKFCFRLRGRDGAAIGHNFAEDDFCSYGERSEE